MHWDEHLIVRFSELANPEHAGSMEAYMKHHFSFFGIKSEERKRVTREVIKAIELPEGVEFTSMIKRMWQYPHREVQYSAMEITHRKKVYRDVNSIVLIEFLITNKSWWDSVDFIASTLCGEYFKAHPDKISEIVRRWNASEDMWLVRSSLLFQLKYKNHVDTTFLSDLILPHLDSKEFFIQKAIGWSLRQVSKTNPSFVRSFIAKHELKPVSLREAKKYI